MIRETFPLVLAWSAPGTGRLQLFVRDTKRVALREIACLKTAPEPADALFRGSVGEGIRDDIPARLLLQPVIADSIGGAQRCFQIPRIENVFHLLGMIAPVSCQKIGLELETHRELVVVRLWTLGRLQFFVRDAERVALG